MGLPSRSFAADAHDCIMVRIRMESTEYKCVARCSAPDGELPSDHLLPDPLTNQPYPPPRNRLRAHRRRLTAKPRGPLSSGLGKAAQRRARSAGDRIQPTDADVTGSLSRWVHRGLP